MSPAHEDPRVVGVFRLSPPIPDGDFRAICAAFAQAWPGSAIGMDDELPGYLVVRRPMNDTEAHQERLDVESGWSPHAPELVAVAGPSGAGARIPSAYPGSGEADRREGVPR